MIRMSATQWTVEADDITTTTRFAEAVRTYDSAPSPKRILRNGRPLRMTDDPTLFEETTCSSS